MSNIVIIVAMDNNNVIGISGKMPWRLSRDMGHFSEVTGGKTVVMGRKTYESLSPKFRPLPKRENIILTRDPDFFAPGCTIVTSVEQVLMMSLKKEIWVIGGGEIYRLFLPHTSRMLVTHVDTCISGDMFFPEIEGRWLPNQLFRHEADEKNQFSFSIVEYTKE